MVEMIYLDYFVDVIDINLQTLSVKSVCCGFDRAYWRTLGMLGKHGLQGFCNEELLCFEGSLVLDIPENFLRDKYVKIDRLNVQISHSGKVTEFSFENLDWFGLYDIGKRCFAVGEFTEIILSDKVTVYFQKGCRTDASKESEVLARINSLYRYYKNIFGDINQDRYDIYLLNCIENKETEFPLGNCKIFAGAGQTSQGASFNPNQQRDWELLSHRMFHAFIDSSFKNQSLLIPPYLWLYEGLAVYHELESTNGDWEELEARYYYAKEKYKPKLDIDPMQEESLSPCGYETEFLHYTQAPLIIKRNQHLNILQMLQNGANPSEIIAKMDISLRNKQNLSLLIEESDSHQKLKHFDYILKTWGI